MRVHRTFYLLKFLLFTVALLSATVTARGDTLVSPHDLRHLVSLAFKNRLDPIDLEKIMPWLDESHLDAKIRQENPEWAKVFDDYLEWYHSEDMGEGEVWSPRLIQEVSEHLEANKLHKWADLEIFQEGGNRALQNLPEPSDLEKGFLHYIQIQNRDFHENLKKVYIEAAKQHYLSYFKDCFGCVPEEIFFRSLVYIVKQVQKKTEHDDPNYDYLALKIVFRKNHSGEDWIHLSQQIKDHLGPQLNGSSEVFWSVARKALEDYLATGEPLQDTLEEILEKGQILSQSLSEGDTKNNVFSASLKGLIKVTYPESENLKRSWKFFEAVEEEFQSRAKLEVDKFILKAEAGHLRGNGHSFKKIRFSVVVRDGYYHLIAKAEVEGSDTVLFAINPPHNVRQSPTSLDPRAFELQKYMWAMKSDVVVIDYHGGSFRPENVYIQPSRWNPKRYFYVFRAKYSPTTSGSRRLAAASVGINGGIRTAMLASAAAIDPRVEFSWTAVGIFSAYMIFCAAWNQFYDNLMESDQPWIETAKKIAFKTPFTLAILALTLPDASPLAIIALSLPLNFTEKMGSTYNRRLIRYLDREKELTGQFHLRLGFFNPLRWAQLVYYSAKDGKIKAKRLSQDVFTFRAIKDIVNPLWWVKESRSLASTFKENIELSRTEEVSLASFSKPVGLREMEGYVRNAINSAAATIDQTLGFPVSLTLQVTLGEISNLANLIFARARLHKFKAEKHEENIEFYEGEIEKIKDHLWYIPGLGRLVKALKSLTEGPRCKDLVQTLAPSSDKTYHHP